MVISAALMDRYRPLLRLQIRRFELDHCLRRRFDSSDLIQETILRAVERIEQFRGQSEAEAIRWLQEILRTVVLNKIAEAQAMVRDVRRERSIEELVADSSARIETWLAQSGHGAAEQVSRAEEILRLAHAIDQLPEDQRDALNLRVLHGCTVPQIAELLGRTEKAIAGLIYRARLSLRELLVE